MAEKVKLGVIGANPTRGWGPRGHLPAIVPSRHVELTAVCTTRKESAEASAAKYGAKMAFDDYREMLACPDIEAVAVLLRVPAHYQVTMDALNAGKHVFTEWPLGNTTAEAVEMRDLAEVRGLTHMVGLQARGNPAVVYARDLVADGYVGEVMACHVSAARGGVLQRPSDRTWQRDNSLGATTLTIPCAHTIDALRFIVGDFASVSAVVSTQARQWLETDTQRYVDVTAPDNVLVSGRLANGAVASVYVAAVPLKAYGYGMEIYGREGTLAATSANTPQIEVVRLRGAKTGDTGFQDLPVPSEYVKAPAETPEMEPRNVGEMYVRFADAIRNGTRCEPDFNTAVDLHRLVDAIAASSEQGRAVEL
ncbi:MAG: Gfo/Idh/MocA family oxidoreductase [Deltaproteobacteria bacterium]|nr:Gfo/Idh/MocA family oxidoreductase [Deltaproteobacteria bacterium]